MACIAKLNVAESKRIFFKRARRKVAEKLTRGQLPVLKVRTMPIDARQSVAHHSWALFKLKQEQYAREGITCVHTN
ncbi:hypothetical protein KIN20_013933 [Parelaphostrongylus tenuis]|uniref:Uncharacterized protein n=1 Tax=Parelaphostrongylus tenuis TaxID=148309 RepID=A0AAD5MGB7_PARTN|nr:hypothetical protein KIN20_013933 [Parelaphostrongylus tenuis]